MKKLLVLIIPLLTSCGQNQLIGTWALVKEEPKIEESLQIDITSPDSEENTGKHEKYERVLQFLEDGRLFYNQGSELNEVRYKLKDTVLELGNRVYFIQKSNSTELVLKEDTKLYPKTFYYKKFKKKLQP